MDADVAARRTRPRRRSSADAQAMVALDAAKKDSAAQVDKQASAIADQIIQKVVNV